LEYVLGEENSYLFLVTSKEFASYRLPRRSEIEKRVLDLRDLIIARSVSQDEKDYVARIQLADNEYPKAAADLTELLLRPVADRLGKLRLVIVADGALQYLPFEALPSPQTARSASPTPLIVDHEIVNLPSASTLAVIRNEATHRRPSDRTIAVA